MADGWSVEILATFVAAVIGALVSSASIVVTVVEARTARRNTEILARRAAWWERWTWIAERVLSSADDDQQTGLVLLNIVQGLPWASLDDRLAASAIARARDERKDRP